MASSGLFQCSAKKLLFHLLLRHYFILEPFNLLRPFIGIYKSYKCPDFKCHIDRNVSFVGCFPIFECIGRHFEI